MLCPRVLSCTPNIISIQPQNINIDYTWSEAIMAQMAKSCQQKQVVQLTSRSPAGAAIALQGLRSPLHCALLSCESNLM